MTTILFTDNHALIRDSIRGQRRGHGDGVMSVEIRNWNETPIPSVSTCSMLIPHSQKNKGARVAIRRNAHSTQDFDNLSYGIGQARHGWLEKKAVLKTRSLKELRVLLKRTM